MKGTQATEFRHRSVGEVVSEDYRRAAIFKRHGIDFCCGGGRTVQVACELAGATYDDVERELQAVRGASEPAAHPDPRGWDVGFLADYVVNVHHRYVRETLPVLRQFSEKVARVHGEQRTELVEIHSLVEKLTEELSEHMAHEETLLFPYIKKLAAAGRNPGAHPRPARPTLEDRGDVLRAMEEDHDQAGELMRQIRHLSDDFTPPEGACRTYCATFATLEEFEEDLHRHVHLENNLLFPAAASLEDEPLQG